MTRLGLIAALAASCLVVMALAASIGPAGLHAPLLDGDWVITQLRVPRVLMAGVAGASLALAGVALQALLRNQLAEPYVLGLSGGAAAAAVASLAVFPGLPPGPAAACGALGAAGLVRALARGTYDPARLLLCGVTVGSLLASVSGLILVLAPQSQLLRSSSYWLFGGIGTPHGSALIVPVVLLAFAMGWLIARAERLDRLSLGADVAASLGTDVRGLQRAVLLLCVSLVAATVAACGLIGFVGLIAPHAARRLVGPAHRQLLPVSAALGALLLVIADAVARSAFAPREVPVGLLTAALGGPLFLLQLQRAAGTSLARAAGMAGAAAVGAELRPQLYDAAEAKDERHALNDGMTAAQAGRRVGLRSPSADGAQDVEGRALSDGMTAPQAGRRARLRGPVDDAAQDVEGRALSEGMTAAHGGRGAGWRAVSEYRAYEVESRTRNETTTAVHAGRAAGPKAFEGAAQSGRGSRLRAAPQSEIATDGDCVLHAAGLCVGRGELGVLRDVELSVRRGERIALVGENGAGKTTLLRALAGLDLPRAGGLRWGCGALPSGPARARVLGVLLQNERAADFSVRELVTLGLGLDRPPTDAERARVAIALAAAQLSALAERACSSLSGGEAHRAALARALVAEPGLLLLDEPTQHLDVARQAALLHALDGLRGAVAVVLATHDLSLAASCDRVLLLHAGAVAALGSPDTVLTPALLARCLGVVVERRDDPAGGPPTLRVVAPCTREEAA